MSTRSWTRVIRHLESLPAYSVVKIPRKGMPSPVSAGMHYSYGEPEGQEQDYRKSLPGNRGFHVREYPYHYTAHIDTVDVDKDFVGHMLLDSSGAAILTSAAIGASLAMLTDCKRDAIKGAFLGTTAAVIAMLIRENWR